MKLKDRLLAFVDVETTGLDPEKHEMIEFACKTSDGKKIQFKIKPQHIETAHPRALEVNGYTPERWKDAIEPKQAAAIIQEWLEEVIIIGQSIKFDVGFIKALLKREGVEYDNNFLRYSGDTVTLALAHLVPKGLTNLSLKSIMQFLNMEPEPDVHEAMNGVDCCKAVWEKLTDTGFDASKFHKHYSGPEYDKE